MDKERVKQDASSQILKKIPIFLAHQFRITDFKAEFPLVEAFCYDPWIGVEQLLKNGDIEFASMVLQCLQVHRPFGDDIKAHGLIYACQLGLEETTKFILKSDTNVKTECDGYPAIVAACEFHAKSTLSTKVKVVEALLQHPQVNVNALLDYRSTLTSFQFTVSLKNAVYYDMSALHLAAHYGDVEVIKKLLARSDINVNIIMTERHCTPLHFACGFQQMSIVYTTFKNLSKKEQFKPNTEALSLLLSHPDIDVTRQCLPFYGLRNFMPLMIAAVCGHIELISLLLKMPGINVDITSNVHVLHAGMVMDLVQWISIRMCENGQFEEFMVLYDYDNEMIHKKSPDGSTLLHHVVKPRNENTGMNSIRKRNNDGCRKILKFLISLENFDVNAKDGKLATPLHYACNGSIALMKDLLTSEKIDVNAKNKDGVTPLLFVCGSSLEKTKLLLQHRRIEVNLAGTMDGTTNVTPLQWATHMKRYDIQLILYLQLNTL